MEALNATDVTAAIGNLTPTEAAYACQRCEDSGYIYDFDAHKVVGRCECAKEKRAEKLNNWKASSLARLQKLIGERIDLSKTKPSDYMKTASESVWLHGIAGKGKTHAAAWVIERAINTAAAPFEWGWYPIRKLVDAWRSQYDDFVDLRIEALTILRQLEREEIIVIDDIDKIGTITAAREEEFFNLIDSIHARKVQLIVTSQNNIDAFCDRMSREALFIKRDGLGPQQRRLKEICKEIRL